MSRIRKMAVIGLTTAALAGGTLASAAIPASAATANVTTVSSVQRPVQAVPALQGFNILQLRFLGQPFRYNVFFRSFQVGRNVWIIRGTLRDNFEPIPLTLRIQGFQVGRHVEFSVVYPSVGPDAGTQGTRTFDGTIVRGFFGSNRVSGNWSETGTEGGFGSWSLLLPLS